ncbi:MAG: hypothetical protein KBT12_08465 [Bacteroidales bacterium]|nr:hypothetical protein [Candidatus Physcousia equi]
MNINRILIQCLILSALTLCTNAWAIKRGAAVDNNTVMETFTQYVQQQRYYADYDITAQRKEVRAYVDAMQYIEDKENYIQQNRLNGYVADARDSISKYRAETGKMVNAFLSSHYPDGQYQIADKQACMDDMQRILEAKLAEREATIASLSDAIKASMGEEEGEGASKGQAQTLIIVGIIVAVLLIVVIALLLSRNSKPRKPRKPTQVPVDKNKRKAEEQIVVRRKTMTILKQQTLEDVVDNPAYLKIDCSEICQDTAVRYIYLKNSCAREIYNMYENDLNKPGRIAEDGCMVLGRWVYDKEGDEYYVSMEHVVMPGDDAVFKEYELNFGGKIKLKMAEALRRLRRDTNMQYDLTCWIHSHPGLGVFFSNADSAVHLQLKHPTHPRFLCAFVVDILTEEQELSVFTFRHDQNINAKPDLKKMFSLVALNEWAIQSEQHMAQTASTASVPTLPAE